MDTIKIVLETEQSCSTTYHLNCQELHQLLDLIENKGKAIIADHAFEATDYALLQFKKGTFGGANYAIPFEGLLKRISFAIDQNC